MSRLNPWLDEDNVIGTFSCCGHEFVDAAWNLTGIAVEVSTPVEADREAARDMLLNHAETTFRQSNEEDKYIVNAEDLLGWVNIGGWRVSVEREDDVLTFEIPRNARSEQRA